VCLLDALLAGFGVEQSLKNGEDMAAIFHQAREDVAQGGFALGLAMPFEKHLLWNLDVAAEFFGRMPTQEQTVEEGRLPLREVELVQRLFDRRSGGWNRRAGVGLLHLALETEEAVYRKFFWRQVVRRSRGTIFIV
jgi:hypothetical protein